MHCSELHQHLADMHIIENNLCACGQPETSEHFFLYLSTLSRCQTQYAEVSHRHTG